MIKKKYIISCFSLGVMLMASVPAQAQAQAIGEPLMYPGANCVKLSGTGNPTINETGRIVNNNTSATVSVLCSMYDNGKNFAGNVWVINPLANQSITCTSWARNPLGNPTASQPKTLSSYGSDTKSLDFNGPTADGTFTYRYYVCSLPPKAQLINYRGKATN